MSRVGIFFCLLYLNFICGNNIFDLNFNPPHLASHLWFRTLEIVTLLINRIWSKSLAKKGSSFRFHEPGLGSVTVVMNGHESWLQISGSPTIWLKLINPSWFFSLNYTLWQTYKIYNFPHPPPKNLLNVHGTSNTNKWKSLYLISPSRWAWVLWCWKRSPRISISPSQDSQSA